MYKVAELKTGLIGELGWRQNADSAGWQLTDMTTSDSGLWFNDVHPSLTIDNLISAAPRFQDLYGTQAEIDDAFTAWVKEKTEAGIILAIEDWFNMKMGNATAGNLLARNKLFEVTGNFVDLDQAGTDMVGFEISTPRSRSLRGVLKQFSLQLDTDQAVTVYLFRSRTKAPIQTQVVNYAGSGSEQWTTVDWELEGGETYWLAYDQSLLTGQSINGVKEYAAGYSGYSFFPTGRFYSAVAFNAAVGGTSELWDLTKNVHTTSTNYGINIDMRVECDYTDFILDQKHLFKTAIWLQVGMMMLRTLGFNPEARINRNEKNLLNQRGVDLPTIQYEIDGDGAGSKNSIASRYFRAIKSIQFDTARIDPICMKCKSTGAAWKVTGPAGYNRSLWTR